MPLSVTFDTVAGASLQANADSPWLLNRTGVVEGIPESIDPSYALYYVTTATGMPSLGTQHPTIAGLRVNSIRVDGLVNDSAFFTLLYKSNDFPIGSTYIIDVSARGSTFQTNMMPGTRDPFAVSYVPESGDTNGAIREDYVVINMLQIQRRVSVTQLIPGTITPDQAAAFSEFAGYVNNNQWMNKKKGSWLIDDATSTIGRNGFYNRRISAISNGDNVWSYFGSLYSQQLGKYAISKATKTLISSLVNEEYQPKSIRPTDKDQRNKGVLRIDPYPMTNFVSLFGFGANVSPFGLTDPVDPNTPQIRPIS